MRGRACTDKFAPEIKAEYLRKLIDAGFKHIDAVSFVSPSAVPQMADSEQVLAQLTVPSDVEIIGIVVNEKGAQRAVIAEGMKTAGISVFHLTGVSSPESDTRLSIRRSTRCNRSRPSPASENRNVVAYVSMAFGNPYGEAWSYRRSAAGVRPDC